MSKENKTVELKDEELEKVSGGFTPEFDDNQPSFLYDDHVYRWIINPGELMPLNHGGWACRLDENNNPTGIYVQIPNGAYIVNLKK